MFIDDAIYRQYRGTVRSVAFGYGRTREEREDLEQTAWLTILTCPEPPTLTKAWVSVVTQHDCQNRRYYDLVRERGQAYVDDHDPDSDHPLELGELGDSDLPIEDPAAGDLRDAIGRLPDDQRELINRKFYRGESTEEIAEDVGLAARSIDQRLEKVQSQIRSSLPSRTGCGPSRRRKVDLRPYTRLRSDCPCSDMTSSASKTTILERLSSGHVIHQHQHLDPDTEQAAAEIIARERQEFYSYPITVSRRPETSKITVQVDHLPDIIQIVTANPHTRPDEIVSRFGYGPAYARKVLSKARKIAGVKCSRGRFINDRRRALSCGLPATETATP